jgi:predicted nucleic acid-binding protein
MRNGSSTSLVDPNVVVYAYDPTDGAKAGKRAITVLECLRACWIGAVNAQLLGEFFVTVTRNIPSPLTEAEAERRVTHDVRSWVVYDLTELVVRPCVGCNGTICRTGIARSGRRPR